MVSAIQNPDVAAVFRAYPTKVRRRLMSVRSLLLETAASTEGVGTIEETLKWGEPAYLTSESGSGTTVRLAWKSSVPDEYAVCVHCQTSVIEECRARFRDTLQFDGNRRIVFAVGDPLPREAVSWCLHAALTYHRRRRRQRRVPRLAI